MKLQHYTFLITTTLFTILFGLTTTRSLAESISVNGNLSEPITRDVTSGGEVDSSDCGFISETPEQVIEVTEKMNYMRMSLEGASSKATLLVEGPDGRFCILPDSGEEPSMSGVWVPGEYKIYVGDQDGDRDQYTLRLSTEQ
ncbi:MAG: hypothetical protein ACLFQP_06290 [Halothece sp.]